VAWSHGKNDQPRPGRGKLVKPKPLPFPAVNKGLSYARGSIGAMAGPAGRRNSAMTLPALTSSCAVRMDLWLGATRG
jgi:hypothetical protein